jgi:hypothetical protein
LTTSALAVTTQAGADAPEKHVTRAVAAPEEHVTRVFLRELRSRPIGNWNIGNDALRRNGRVVGYDAFQNRYNPTSDRLILRLALSLRGGIILGRVSVPASKDGALARGPIQGGNGRFTGIEGRIVATPPNGVNGDLRVTLRWHIAQ